MADLRCRFPDIFEAYQTMQQFMWQPNLLQDATILDAGMKRLQTVGPYWGLALPTYSGPGMWQLAAQCPRSNHAVVYLLGLQMLLKLVCGLQSIFQKVVAPVFATYTSHIVQCTIR